MSITLNGLPPYWKFNGTAFLLQPTSESKVDKVVLLVQSYAGGRNPLVSYTVSACGPRPYSADLVLTGNAQITDAKPFGLYPTPLPQIRRFSGNIFYLQSVYVLGSAQLIKFDLPKAPCQEDITSMTYEMEGLMLGPLQQSWSGPWGLWHGPHTSQSWPQIGFSTDLAPTNGPFTLPGIPGKWALPSSLNIEVSQGYAAPGWFIDSSMPSTSTPYPPSWSGTNEIRPSAQLTDTASVALLQDWIVVCAIGFGIGGAMLASLLFDWIRPGEHQSKSSDQLDLSNSGAPISRLQQPHRMKRRISTRLVILALTFIVGYACRRRRRKS